MRNAITIVITIAATEIDIDATVFKATNSGTGKVTSRLNVVAAVSRWTPAQSNVRPTNRRVIAGRSATSGCSGTKSWASRAITGRPSHADPAKIAARAMVVATGWMKYANVLPLASPTTERTVSPTVASTSSAGIRWWKTSRRPMAP